ncbi:MAG: BamA/TamA family outer membrane protein [Chitinophagales bacterium]|nr:BamA/TamA family outer membrane protein [Chitinophagales bacterium]
MIYDCQKIPPAVWLRLLLLSSLFWYVNTSFAQQKLLLQPDTTYNVFLPLLKGFQPAPGKNPLVLLPDSLPPERYVGRLLEHLRRSAYLTASADTLRKQGDSLICSIQLGPYLRWLKLLRQLDSAGNTLPGLATLRKYKFDNTPLAPDAVLELQRRILNLAENNGYPFAAVRLDSLQQDSTGNFSAIVRLDSGPYMTFSGIAVRGDVKLPPQYLSNFLDLQAGMPYSRAKVLRIKDQLRALLFLEVVGNPTVTFTLDGARVNLNVKKKRAGRFDFVLGILPQNNTGNNDARVLLTGSLNAAFQNALNAGERFTLDMERLRPEQQKLEALANVPWVFGTPLGVEGRISIFRRDSSWVDAHTGLTAQYLFAGGNALGIFWENRSSNLQKVDTLKILQERRLPATLDLRQNSFGLEFQFNRLDYRYNPRRGWAVSLKAGAGFNTVQRNTTIENLRDPMRPETTFAALYDTLPERSARFRGELRADYFVPLFQRATFRLALRSAGIFAAEPVYFNEQYRLGGNKLLRGFNEETLFATRYAVGTAELRLLTGVNSYLAVFYDMAYLQNFTQRVHLHQRPSGAGFSLNIETQAGIFGITAAVGQLDTGLGFDFRAAKFHLGYVSLF